MNTLRTASEARQAKSEELKKIITNLEKRARNKGVIKISEILDDPDNKTEEEEDELPDEDAELGPRVKEDSNPGRFDSTRTLNGRDLVNFKASTVRAARVNPIFFKSALLGWFSSRQTAMIVATPP